METDVTIFWHFPLTGHNHRMGVGGKTWIRTWGSQLKVAKILSPLQRIADRCNNISLAMGIHVFFFVCVYIGREVGTISNLATCPSLRGIQK